MTSNNTNSNSNSNSNSTGNDDSKMVTLYIKQTYKLEIPENVYQAIKDNHLEEFAWAIVWFTNQDEQGHPLVLVRRENRERNGYDTYWIDADDVLEDEDEIVYGPVVGWRAEETCTEVSETDYKFIPREYKPRQLDI